MLSSHLICLLILFCFAQSKPAENDEGSARGPVWKITKERGNRKCFCGNLRLPDYVKGSKDYSFYEKVGGTPEDYTDFELTKSKKVHKKCYCFKMFNGLEKKENTEFETDISGETLYIPNVENGYQMDRYEVMTDKPLRYLSSNGYWIEKNDNGFIRKQREKRSNEFDKGNGVTMKLEEQPKDEVETIVKETENIANHHNKNKSAEALEKIGYGLGVASEIVQQVGDRVGQTFGGQMAKSVLDQVSFGLGLASNAANSAAERKRSSGSKKKRSVKQEVVNSGKTSEKITSPGRISGESFIQMWRMLQASPHHQAVNTMMKMKPAVQNPSSSFSIKSSAGLKL